MSERGVQRAALPLLLLAALLSVLPMLLQGASCGHDFDFHVTNWLEIATQWKHGTLWPRTDFSAAWNAGEPRFVFYPPLSTWLGALLTFVVPIRFVPIVFAATAIFAAGAATWHMCRQVLPAAPSLAAAIVLMTNPYMLFTVYERTAEAELLAAAAVVLLAAALVAELSVVRIAAAVALVWLTNAPAAVGSCYVLLVALLLRLLYRRHWPDARTVLLRGTAGVALGLGLAAFYLVPAIMERPGVQIAMANLPGMRPADNFLFGHTVDADHDAVLRTASWLATGFFVALAVLFPLAWRSCTGPEQRHRRTLVATCGGLCLLVLLLLLPWSAALWNYLPELSFLQFPWRLLVTAAPLLALLLACALEPWAHRRPALSVALAFVFAAGSIFLANQVFFQSCDPDETAAALATQFNTRQGFAPTDEYTPVDADNDALKPHLPAAWVARTCTDAPQGGATGVEIRDDNRPPSATVELHEPACVVLLQRLWTGWHVEVDGHPATKLSPRDDGLLALELAAGHHTVAAIYRTPLHARVGWSISLACLAGLLLAGRRTGKHLS